MPSIIAATIATGVELYASIGRSYILSATEYASLNIIGITAEIPLPLVIQFRQIYILRAVLFYRRCSSNMPR